MLDDGVMRSLDARDTRRAVARLTAMVETSREEYGADVALVTCSAVTCSGMAELRTASRIPIVKIDEPMTRAAARIGGRIGVVATFPATVESTRELLESSAPEPVTIRTVLADEALRALLRGDQAGHDRLFFDAVARLAAEPLDALVLAQVSMARLHAEVQARVACPVFSSLASSLEAVRSATR